MLRVPSLTCVILLHLHSVIMFMAHLRYHSYQNVTGTIYLKEKDRDHSSQSFLYSSAVPLTGIDCLTLITGAEVDTMLSCDVTLIGSLYSGPV